MSAIRKSLLQLMFSGSYMRRWNDKLRPVELYEIDKQAHKMIVAWMLTLLNSGGYSAPDQRKLQQEVIERGLFDYLYRLVTTDIKPPVFYRICENEKDYKELTEWVLKELRPVLGAPDEGFWERLSAYHRNRDRTSLSDRILTAAHLYASGWEYNIIKPFNMFDEENQSIAESFTERLNGLTDLCGVNELIQGHAFFSDSPTALGRFAKLCGQLRFQIRWADTPRVPETSVLGHMFLVAGYAYFFSLSLGTCPARRINNFFAGLFHDLPELLTRDIITPVKRSVNQLPSLLRAYELQELERRVFGPLSAGGHDPLAERLRYYLGLVGEGVTSEFDETIRDSSGQVRRLGSFDALHADGNEDCLDPKDGALLKVCDNLAAFIEAHSSVRTGISSPNLHEAIARIRGDFRHRSLGPLSLGTIIADFD
ncbi:HD domain-containing protein [uncultured Bilophila sp.]|uniref:HD domain-containing protein n=1 Tax=uncultured Bilophila sp. TaxID=529385 RepID=UPI0026707CCC|nr:HD domain-containing protein [uncultured Bilophila sp.]